jgi:uncharacterized protein (TIGR00251 family)
MQQKEQVVITVHVQPNAKQNKVVSFIGNVLKVKIAALPISGKANKELIKFLSSLLGISKSDLFIEKCITSEIKKVAIIGMSLDKVKRKLGKY